VRIVVVEDNENVAKGIAYRLRDIGYAVDLLHDGNAADEFLAGDGADLAVIDINLPGLDGLSLVRKMRARGDGRPVIMLTAMAELEDRVAGLDSGADDYLAKPFQMAELEARIRALSRRLPQQITEMVDVGSLSFDAATREARVDGRRLDLPRRELSVLECLVTAAGRTVTKSVLLDNMYGTGADVDETVVEVYVSRLRKRLRPHGIEIKVRRGLGYVLAEAGPA